MQLPDGGFLRTRGLVRRARVGDSAMARPGGKKRNISRWSVLYNTVCVVHCISRFH